LSSEIKERAVGRHREPGRAERRLAGFFDRTGKTVGKDDKVTGSLAVFERLEHHVVATLRQRRTIPRTMECNESAVVIGGRKGLAGIDQEIVRRLMSGE
jgi:hypothetical protein